MSRVKCVVEVKDPGINILEIFHVASLPCFLT
jgi:hypothetical protein